MNSKKSNLIKASLFALSGIIFILFPSVVSKYIIIILGSLVVAYGIVTLLSSIKTNNNLQTKLGIIVSICGIIIILLSNFILSFIGICIALYCMFSGISYLGLGFRINENQKLQVFYLIRGAIAIILSVLFFTLPKSAVNTQVILLGIYLLFSATNQIYKAFTSQDNIYDFVKVHFHNDIDNEDKIKNDSIIDVESSVVENDDDEIE